MKQFFKGMNKINNLFLIIITGIVYFIFNFLNSKSNIYQEINEIESESTECFNYRKECLDLFKKLRYPNKSLIIRPPVRMPPADLIDRFTQNGDMPILRQLYYNQVYSDSNSNVTALKLQISFKEFNEWLFKVKNNQPLNYGDKYFHWIMRKYKNEIKDKSLVVIGTEEPWIEAIGYDLSASQITTLDYTRKKYQHKRLEWLHVNDYLDDMINNKIQLEQFDNSASFSSIEHSGLGRYGDPLSPEGDIDAVRQVHCMLKPNGLFFLGLPCSTDDSSYIEFNAHRVYGSKRLNLLFNGWSKKVFKHGNFVLKKKKIC